MRYLFYSFIATVLTLPCLVSGAVYQSIDELQKTVFDFVIIGGGTAGSVVANRLSERSEFDVLVIEAGSSGEGVLDIEVPAFSFNLENTVFDWNYTTVPGSGINNRSLPYPRAHVLGGCSAHNAMFYTRGSSDDYDRWAVVTGDPGWSWQRLLPYMLKSEHWSPPADRHNTTGQFDPSVHGFDGPLLTSLAGFPQPSDDMVLTVSEQLPDEFPFLLDMNARRPLGLGWFQGTIGNGTRSSAASAFLSSKVTRRSNLHVLLNTKANFIRPQSPANLNFNTVEIAGTKTVIKSRKELILSAGPINTPQILLNSGIGDSSDLRLLGIQPLIDLPSVGKNLTDQLLAPLTFSVSSNNTLDNLQNNATLQAEALAQWEFNRTGPDVNPGPNQIVWARIPADSNILSQFEDPSAGPNTPHIELAASTGLGGGTIPGINATHFIGMGIVVVTPASRGSVSLNETNLLGNPVIDIGAFTEDFDIATMLEGYKIAQQFFSAPIWDGYIIEQVIPSANTTSDEDLSAFIRASSFPTLHAVGTAAMSATDATYGVVNPNLMVKGAHGLRIIDGSILPFIIAGRTQAPIYAIAERASDLIKKAWIA